MRRGIWRLVTIRGKRLLSLRGDRRIIARGIAVGVAMNFIPTVGLGVPIVYWVAGLARGHRVASIVSTMSIKAIFPLLYILNYIVGELVLQHEFIYTLNWHLALHAGASFLLGSAINFVASFALTYYCSLWVLIRKQRERCNR
jgi:uncharacterized protein